MAEQPKYSVNKNVTLMFVQIVAVVTEKIQRQNSKHIT